MQTAAHAEHVVQSAGRRLIHNFVKRDQRECLGTQRGRVLKPHVVLQFRRFALAVIPLLARNLAGSASDALCDVD
jgi:hypothetical protein